MCSICIETVFRGPPTSGNGGYVAGMFAKHLHHDSEVMLLKPPPLETDLKIKNENELSWLMSGEEQIAKATKIKFPDFEIPAAPSFEEAVEASKDSPSISLSEKIDCFVCSMKRKQGEGLRIFAGAIGRDNMVAAPWYPYESLADEKGIIKEEFIWAALDCPGAFAAYAYEDAPFLLLGKQSAHINQQLSVKEDYIACGWHVKKDGRKHFTNTAVFSKSGEFLACANQVWIEVK